VVKISKNEYFHSPVPFQSVPVNVIPKGTHCVLYRDYGNLWRLVGQ
jgi:hypothetical protein